MFNRGRAGLQIYFSFQFQFPNFIDANTYFKVFTMFSVFISYILLQLYNTSQKMIDCSIKDFLIKEF